MNHLAPILLTVAMLFGLSTVSCQSIDSQVQSQAACADCEGTCSAECQATKMKSVAITLCGGCGQVKGSPSCCLDGVTKCTQCGLDGGAPGCCKMEKGTDAKLCGCGAMAGSDECVERCAAK